MPSPGARKSSRGLGITVLLLVFGFVLRGEANFADQYVRDQFAQQGIYFTSADELTEEEAQAACLVENGQGDEAERLLDSGEEAECYANEYIGLHVRAATGGLSDAELVGSTAGLAANIAFLGAAVMLLLSIAGFIHWATTPRDHRID